MRLPAFETYCGGRARSGKTDLILGAAITQHQDAIIFRTEYSQIKDLVKRSREILRGTGASYNGTDKIWQGIPGNRTLEFGALKNDGDEDRYFGRPHDLICFDEIPKFKEEHYRIVWGWAVPSGENPKPAHPYHLHRQPADKTRRVLGQRTLGGMGRRQTPKPRKAR